MPRQPPLAVALAACILALALPGCASRVARGGSGAVFPAAAVAADHPVASDAGAEVLQRGGNAVDAAVATSFTLSVVRPYSCGIGGGGFMVVHLPDDPVRGRVTVAINYRETAPAAAGPGMFEGSDDPHASTRGGRAVAVPGTVAGLLFALEQYGTMDLASVLAPAIRAAEEGFAVDAHYMAGARPLIRQFDDNPEWKGRFGFVWERFLREGAVREGDIIRLPEQAEALRLIARDGAAAFYAGPIAEAIAAAVARDGGLVGAADLDGYTFETVPPLAIDAFGRTFLTMPPPSSGGVALGQVLGMLQLIRSELLADGRRWSPRTIHLVTETIKHAFADRARWMADPAFVDVPVDALLDPVYLAALNVMTDPTRTLPPSRYGSGGVPFGPGDDAGTSHFCVVDDRGGAVACTETINLVFGSLLAVPEYGFVLNNEMDDFTTRRGAANAFGLVQSDANLPEPWKRPLSSMTPTIVLDGAGRVQMVAGASGGPRIITGTLLAMLNVILYDDGARGAVAAPRFHHQWQPDVLYLEEPLWAHPDAPAGVSVAEAMRRYGHEVRPAGDVGNVQLIRRTRDQRAWDAASDPRKGGRPAGY